MQVGTGRSILNGIAIGKLKIYKKKDTVISTAEIADTAAEVARFEAAQQKAIEQQTALYEKALAEAGEDIAEVFNIHAMMLEDDDFVDAIKEIINGQHKCAEYAVKTAGDNQAAVFAANTTAMSLCFFSASRISLSEDFRPTVIGRKTPGNNTILRRGRTGRISPDLTFTSNACSSLPS